MRNTSIIFLKEFRTHFNSPIAYIVLVAFLAISGWFFAASLFLVNQSTIRGFVDIVPLLFILFVPAITMRLLAEEERLGTIEILTTLPIAEHHIVLGKYLSSVALLAVGLAFSLVYPISVHFLGNLDWGEVVSSYLGLLLLGAGFGAIGMFSSSLSRSQIVSFIVALVICFFFFILGKVLPIVPAPLVTVIEYLSLDFHFENMIRGVIDSRNVIYYLSMTGLFLSLSLYSFRRSRGRGVPAASVLAVFGIVLVVNYLSFRVFKRLDLTQGNIYSLSRASVKLVRELDDVVVVKGYITKDLPFPYNAHSKYLRDLLSEYKATSRGKVRFELVNPAEQKEKMEARRQGVLPLKFTEVKADKYEVREGYMGVVFLYEDKSEVIPVVESLGTLEYDITSKIKKLTSRELKSVGFTTGHGEVDIGGLGEIEHSLRDRLRIQRVNLKEGEVPSDLNSLLIIGPKERFEQEELSRIDSFIMRGGTAGFLIDKVDVDLNSFRVTKTETNIDTLPAGYGITVKEGLVLDLRNQTIGLTSVRAGFVMRNFVPYPPFPLVADFDKENPIVRELESVTLPFVSPLEGGDALVRSSERSWWEQNPGVLNPLEGLPSPGGKERGPFALAAVQVGKLPSLFGEREGQSRIAVVGTSRIAERQFASPSSLAFFLNLIDWLVEDERLISIRSKGVGERPLKDLSPGRRTAAKQLNIFLPSLLLVGLGLGRWRARRRRRYEI